MPEIQANAWICPICGYIHYGPQPPDECPVCGALKEVFEPYYAPAAAPKRWLCLDCGYMHEGANPPDECPVCGAPAERFELLEETASGAASDATLQVVIAGAGIAGVSAAEALRKAAPAAGITLLSNEAQLPYYRLNLTRYLAGELPASQLPLHPQEWYTRNNVDLLGGVELTALDVEKKQVLLHNGRRLPYDRLILAVGAAPFIPPIPGAQRRNVFTLRSVQDADAILAASSAGSCVCIGGGLLGLETAGALARRGVQVTVLESLPWLLPRQLNETAGRLMEARVKKLGIDLRSGARTRELTGGEAVDGVLLEDGTHLRANVVVFSAGVRSRLNLAKGSGLQVNQGILVNDAMQTSNPEIFAAGDAVEHRGVLYGTWAPAQLQGVAAGQSVVGAGSGFKGVTRSNTLKVLGIELFSIGRITPEAGERVVEGGDADRFASFLFSGNLLAGAILLGDASPSSLVHRAIDEKRDFTTLLDKNPNVGNILASLE